MKTRRTPFLLLIAIVLLAAAAIPATGAHLNVDSLSDDGSGGCTLREAVESANSNTAVGGCAPGDPGYDTIYFDVKGTIALTDVIQVTEPAGIVGPNFQPDGPERSGGVTIKAAQDRRAFIFNGLLNSQFFLGALKLLGPDTGQGGGIALLGGDLSISTCIISGTRCTGLGGGIFNLQGSWLSVDSSLVTGNTAKYGGGIYSSGPSELIIRNSIVSGNTAALDGGGVWSDSGRTKIRESTLSGNAAGGSGGGAQLAGNALADKLIVNSILWGNQATANPQIGYAGGVPAVTYSDIEGGAPWPGTGNILADPQFVAPQPASAAPAAEGDYHLRDTSPCVNAGGTVMNEYDIDGDVRFQDATADMGADEAGPPYNDSFEYGQGVPSPWVGRNLTVADKRVSKARRLGRSSFRFAGGPAVKTIRQALDVAAGQSYDITLSGWSKSSGTSLTGGAYRLDAKIFYDDGSSARLKVPFPKRTHGWTYKTKTLKAEHNVTGVVVYLRYARQTGYAWFDAVKLYIDK